MIGNRALAGLALVAACAAPREAPRAPENGLERALYFVETPRAGRRIPISGDSAQPGTAVTKVAEPREVDLNSRIEVRVAQEELVGGTGSSLSRERVQELAARRDSLVDALAAYGEWLAARPALLDAYARVLELPSHALNDRSAPAWLAFEARQREQSARFQAFGNVLIEEYARTDPEIAAALDEIAGSPTLEGLHALVSGLVADFQAQIDAEIAAREATLRLEAFVLSEGKDPQAIHLEGYDTLEQRRVELDDARAFDVGAAELAEIVSMTVDVANAAKKVDEQNASYLDAFGAISPRIAERLAELDARARELGEQLEPGALSARFERTRTAVERFVERAAQDATEAERAAAEKTRRALVDRFDDVRRLLRDGEAVVRDVRALRDVLRNPRRADFAAALQRASGAYTSIATLKKAIEALAGTGDAREALAQRFTDTLDAAFRELEADVRDRLRAQWAAPDGPRAEIDGWAALFAEARGFVDDVATILEITGGASLPVDASVAEAIEVPVAEVKDTSIDLPRTSREVGDSVVLRATLSEKGEVVSTRDFEFDVVRFGYHDSLQPSVVLVRPDRLAGAEEDFEFAPSLTWAHTYYPRPDETAWFDRFCRTLRPSLGVHAILLDFDDDQATEVGLGATFAIWGDRLQLGAGVNLMAEGDDEGRYYYFVGSSLIPLLQALERDGASD